MAFNAPTPPLGLSNDGKFPGVVDELSSSFSAAQLDGAASIIFNILDQHAVTLDTQFPTALYAESLLYMVYWFHRLRDPSRKNGIQSCIGRYLKVDCQSPAVNALLSDQKLRVQAKRRIDQGVMVRRTVDVLVMRERQGEREFLVLDRAFFPEGMALPGGLLQDEDEQNDTGIPGNIFAALRVTGSKVLRSTPLKVNFVELRQ